MTLPSDPKIIFLLCDDVREEPGGKSTLLGVYGGDIQASIPSTENDAPQDFMMPSLTLYFAFTDGEGSFSFQGSISDPTGKVLMEYNPSELVKKNKDGWMTLAFKVTPFHGPFGTYSARIILDDKTYERSFKVQMAPPKKPEAATTA